MKKYKLLILLFFSLAFVIHSQTFEDYNSKSFLGGNILISESGFGFGTYYGYEFSTSLLGFIDFSVSEVSDDREFEFIDYWGQKKVIGKKNRLFLLPLNFGFQYRLFEGEILDNFRPYITAAIGPNTIFYTPYKYEFFDSFRYGKLKYGVGGYIGLGINFGSIHTYQSINIRYNLVHFFDDGIESLENKPLQNIGSFYLSISFGTRL